MLAAKPLRARFAAPLQGSLMDIRHLTPDYAVSPQITPEDLPTLQALGFTTVINNRPDGEIPAALSTEVMKAAAEALGLTFVINPIRPGDFSDTVLATQGAAIATGKVFAYCASGNRSSCAWALSTPEDLDIDARIAIPAEHGYNLEPLRAMIAARVG
nr:TIGR01244 family sulfur transferase [Rhodobacter sp. KR11]